MLVGLGAGVIFFFFFFLVSIFWGFFFCKFKCRFDIFVFLNSLFFVDSSVGLVIGALRSLGDGSTGTF